MRKDSGKTREEVLLDAIGNLPEDMIAKAAEYSVFQKKTEEQEERKEERDFVFGEEEPLERKAGHKYRRMICRVLAAAACIVLVMIGGNKGGEVFRRYLDRKSVISEQKEVVHQKAPKVSGDSLENQKKEKIPVVKIWADAAETDKDGKSKTKKGDINNSSSQAEEESTDKDSTQKGKKKMKEGVTRLLQVEEVDGRDGEKIPVIKLTFGSADEKLVYVLHSQLGRVVSVIEDGVSKYVNLPDADCKSGGTAELDTRVFAEASWVENPAPEWEDKNIAILNIINISVKSESGKEQEAGKIVIGVKGKKYYGIFKKEL